MFYRRVIVQTHVQKVGANSNEKENATSDDGKGCEENALLQGISEEIVTMIKG
jgi:hypothetical protein